MIHLLRVPTPEQYGYIEFQFEGAADEAIAEYQRLTKVLQVGFGMEERDFRRVLDNYLWGTRTMTVDEYAVMNADQQHIIQTIKRSRKRHER